MNRDYLLPGLVAILLAVLYPVFWLSTMASIEDLPLLEIFRAEVSRLGAMDAMFVLIGLMEVYVLLSLRRALRQELNGSLGAALALAMAIAVALMTLTVLFDVAVALLPGLSEGALDGLVRVAAGAFIASCIAVSLISLVLAVALLVRAADSALLLKLFAVVLLISGLMFLSLILAPIACLVYPLGLLLLAAWFLRGGSEVEVV